MWSVLKTNINIDFDDRAVICLATIGGKVIQDTSSIPNVIGI